MTEQEFFLTGYCRCLDQSRIVEVILEDGSVTEIDCQFGSCPHEPACPIAGQLRTLTESPLS